MKVFVLTSSLTLSTTFIKNQVLELSIQGCKIKTFIFEDLSYGNCTFSYTKLRSPFFIEKIINLIFRRAFKRHNYFNIRAKKELEKQYKEFCPDIILIHFGTDLIKFYPFIKEFKVPVVTIFHGYDASKYFRLRGYTKKLRAILLKKNYYASCVAYDMISRFNVLKIPTERIYFHHLGVDIENFVPTFTNRSLNFIQISNFVEKKGHLITIKGFQKYLQSKNYLGNKLIFAGDGPERKKAEQLVNDLNLKDQIIFLGKVKTEQVKDLMDQNTYFVHHSITDNTGDQEGIPTVIMEAMAMNMKILTSYHSGIPELCSISSCLLVKENNVDEIADAFHTVQNLKGDSRDYIAKNFYLKNNTSKFKLFLEELVNKEIGEW